MSDGWDDLAEAGTEYLVEALREDLRADSTQFQDGFNKIWPVDTNRSRGSLDYYVGAVPADDDGRPAKQPFYAVKGNDEIDSKINAWKLGEEVGFIDQVPYAERLADGYSGQMSAGAIDLLLAEVTSR